MFLCQKQTKIIIARKNQLLSILKLADIIIAYIAYIVAISFLGEVMRHGRWRWFVEHKNGHDRVSACRNVVVVGVVCRGRKTWRECVKADMVEFLVCTLNEQCSGICGEASYWGKC